jgi:hypothetical protein
VVFLQIKLNLKFLMHTIGSKIRSTLSSSELTVVTKIGCNRLHVMVRNSLPKCVPYRGAQHCFVLFCEITLKILYARKNTENRAKRFTQLSRVRPPKMTEIGARGGEKLSFNPSIVQQAKREETARSISCNFAELRQKKRQKAVQLKQKVVRASL